MFGLGCSYNHLKIMAASAGLVVIIALVTIVTLNYDSCWATKIKNVSVVYGNESEIIDFRNEENFNCVGCENAEENDRPIVGILAQESYSIDKYFPSPKGKSYIAASYVKWVESSGARVVPLMIGQDESYYNNITRKINGVLFPGGATWFNESNGYADAGMLIYKIAKKINLPIFGICLGMELLAYADAGGQELRSDCDAYNITNSLNFTPNYHWSKMFKNAPDDIINILETENVTANFHNFCITEKDLKDYNISQNWNVLSTNFDRNNLEYISTFESPKYPIYGVQFHPEKNVFEWKPSQAIPHTRNAIRIAQYFADVFINETRKNTQHFLNKTEEDSALIYNYQTDYIGYAGSSYEQVYMFN